MALDDQNASVGFNSARSLSDLLLFLAFKDRVPHLVEYDFSTVDTRSEIYDQYTTVHDDAKSSDSYQTSNIESDVEPEDSEHDEGPVNSQPACSSDMYRYPTSDSDVEQTDIEDTEPPLVPNLVVYNKSLHGKGKNRKIPCYYCDQFVYQMPRHLQRKHSDETQVAAVLANTSRKRIALQYICNLGIYKYNTEVLKTGDGVLIVNRTPKLRRTTDEFLPCQFCFLFFVKHELYRHCRQCKFRSDSSPIKGFVNAARALLLGSVSTGDSKELNEDVISRMRIDNLKRIATSDNLIMKFGSVLLQKLGKKRALDISARMRELARLLVNVSHNGVMSLSDLISGANFDSLMNAVDSEGSSYVHESGRKLYKSPAFILKAGNSLLKCAQIKRGLALRNDDSVALKEAEDFIQLHTSEFTDRLSSSAHASLRIKGNSLNEYPTESDLRVLKTYQEQRMSVVLNQLKYHADPFIWRELAELTLSRLLVFNARRGSEGAELSMSDYSQMTDNCDPQMVSGFTDLERQLLNR